MKYDSEEQIVSANETSAIDQDYIQLMANIAAGYFVPLEGGDGLKHVLSNFADSHVEPELEGDDIDHTVINDAVVDDGAPDLVIQPLASPSEVIDDNDGAATDTEVERPVSPPVASRSGSPAPKTSDQRPVVEASHANRATELVAASGEDQLAVGIESTANIPSPAPSTSHNGIPVNEANDGEPVNNTAIVDKAIVDQASANETLVNEIIKKSRNSSRS